MKTVLFTGFDPGYAELAKITLPRMRSYAARYQMDFQPFSLPPEGLNIYWTGVARGVELLRGGYDRVFYLDVDQLITNPGSSIEWMPKTGFHCSKDWGTDAIEPWHFSACGWIAHQDCIPMFEEVLAMAPDWMDKPFQEQGPWREWVRSRMENWEKYPSAEWEINVHPRSLFNAVPDDVSPGNVPEPWQPGDFAAHLTMLPMEERLKLARKFC